MRQSDSDRPRTRFLTVALGASLLFAILLAGLPLANAYLAPQAQSQSYLPLVRNDPTPTPIPYYYYDSFDDPSSGWPEINSTYHKDCYHFYYNESNFWLDICDDRTTHTASPLVQLPAEDYVIEFDSRFRYNGGWAHAYGISFDSNDEPDEVRDYIVFRFLWEGSNNHSWSVMQYHDGQELRKTAWRWLSPDYYHYGPDGTAWNHWKVIRTADSIQLFCNGHALGQVDYGRPADDNYFGTYGSSWELDDFFVAWDNYTVYPAGSTVSALDASLRVPFELIDPAERELDRPALPD